MRAPKKHLKKLEVFEGGRLIREWQPVAVGDFPRFLVFRNCALSFGSVSAVI
jgi:hypothetical protein